MDFYEDTHPYGIPPFPDTSSFGLSEVLPIIIGSTGIGFGLIKVMAYSQLEVVRTAMLSRHVQQGGARVLQLGGTTRDLYYYPSGTVQVTVNAIDINKGLFQQAGMTVGVPVEATDLDLRECLQKTRDGSVDSVSRVYHLNNSGTWDDVGTGEVNFVDTGTGTLRITVKSEVDEAELLRHEVDRKIRYLMQGGGTIITWNEPSGRQMLPFVPR
eukprot:jgi/Picre1/32457/NNA_007803.t1